MFIEGIKDDAVQKKGGCPTVPRPMVWKCSCGEEWPESGDNVAAGQAWRHVMQAKKGPDAGKHRGLGLFDVQTNQLLCGFSPGAAVKAGFTTPNPDSLYQTTKVAKKQAGSEVTPPQAKVKQTSPLRGKMPFVEITIPPQLWFLYLWAMAKFDGLESTPECFSDWLVYCIYKFYMTYNNIFGLREFVAKAAVEGGITVGSTE